MKNANVVLNPDMTIKNIVSVDESTARDPACPIDILDTDIFISDVSYIPTSQEMKLPTWDGTQFIEGDPAGFAADKAAEQITRDNAVVQKALIDIDIASVRAIREWIVSQPNPPAILVDHETQAQAERALLK